jgi:Neuraminidase (sialidase)
MIWAFTVSMLLASTASAQHQIVCSGEAAGGDAAFPNVCRLQNGDLYCVFYSGYGHVSTPNDTWPKGGRIMAVRSSDNGKTWSKPVVAIDTDLEDRDPSVARLKHGTLLLKWFTLRKNQVAVLLARSTDHGKTWSEPVKLDLDSPYSFACSAPVRQLPEGSLILGLYVWPDPTHGRSSITARQRSEAPAAPLRNDP